MHEVFFAQIAAIFHFTTLTMYIKLILHQKCLNTHKLVIPKNRNLKTQKLSPYSIDLPQIQVLMMHQLRHALQTSF